MAIYRGSELQSNISNGSLNASREVNDRNNPNTWSIGVEIDFGDGTFGRRYTGTISAAINTLHNQVLFNTPRINIVNVGGQLQYWTAESNFPIGASLGTTTGTLTHFSAIFWSAGDNTVTLRSQSASARTNAPYDVWIRYTKV